MNKYVDFNNWNIQKNGELLYLGHIEDFDDIEIGGRCVATDYEIYMVVEVVEKVGWTVRLRQFGTPWYNELTEEGYVVARYLTQTIAKFKDKDAKR